MTPTSVWQEIRFSRHAENTCDANRTCFAFSRPKVQPSVQHNAASFEGPGLVLHGQPVCLADSPLDSLIYPTYPWRARLAGISATNALFPALPLYARQRSSLASVGLEISTPCLANPLSKVSNGTETTFPSGLPIARLRRCNNSYIAWLCANCRVLNANNLSASVGQFISYAFLKQNNWSEFGIHRKRLSETSNKMKENGSSVNFTSCERVSEGNLESYKRSATGNCNSLEMHTPNLAD